MSDPFVPFPVPPERVADVAVFLYGGREAMPEAAEEPVVPMSEEQHKELLTRVYVESEPTFRRLLMLLADRSHPDSRISFTDVSASIGWSSARSLPGALGAYGRRSKHRYGGYWPFLRHSAAGATSPYLSMEEEVAAFLRDLHATPQLPTE